MGAVTTAGVNFLTSDLGRQIEHETEVRYICIYIYIYIYMYTYIYT
jgi:hypothetical protein